MCTATEMWWGGGGNHEALPHRQNTRASLLCATLPLCQLVPSFPSLSCQHLFIKLHNGSCIIENPHSGARRAPARRSRLPDQKSGDDRRLRHGIHDGRGIEDRTRALPISSRFSTDANQDFPSISSPQQSPFTFCAVLLLVESLIDLVLLSNIPFHEALDEALPYIRPLRNGNLPAEDLQVLHNLPEYITKSLTVYWAVWIGVAGCKFAVYAGLAFFIYQGRADGVSAYTSAAALGGLDRLKNRVVFTFAFLEMMFWFWVSATLRSTVIGPC